MIHFVLESEKWSKNKRKKEKKKNKHNAEPQRTDPDTKVTGTFNRPVFSYLMPKMYFFLLSPSF